jgi:hypothetical protein
MALKALNFLPAKTTNIGKLTMTDLVKIADQILNNSVKVTVLGATVSEQKV